MTVGAAGEAGAERIDNGLAMSLRWCPPGTFTADGIEAVPNEGSDEEDWGEPKYIRISTTVTHTAGFWLGTYPVTQSEFEAVMGPGSNRSVFRDREDSARRPVENVSWDDAVVFCRELSEHEQRAGRLPEGWAYRLPTQGQWDYACRAGGATIIEPGDEAQLAEYAWFRTQAATFDLDARKAEQTHPAGLKRANSWGLHDMQGNVAEWCRDAYTEATPAGIDPFFAPIKLDTDRAQRGGYYGTSAWACGPMARAGACPTDRYRYVGFRVALVPLREDEPDDPRERTARSLIRTSRKAAVEGRPTPVPPESHDELRTRIEAFLAAPEPGGKASTFYQITDKILRQYLDGEFPDQLTEARGLLVIAAESAKGDAARIDGDEEDRLLERAALYRGLYQLLYDENVEDFNARDHEWSGERHEPEENG